MAGKKFICELGDERRVRLDAFCEASRGVSKSAVIREAIDLYLETELEAEPRLRAKYNAALSRRSRKGAGTLRIVDSGTD